MLTKINGRFICDLPDHSWCNRCKQELHFIEFHKQANRWNGVSNFCAQCQGIKTRRKARPTPAQGNKICNVCEIEKPLDCFVRSNRTTDGRDRRCKSCLSEYKKKYQSDNKEKIRQKSKEFYILNRDRLIKKTSDYVKVKPEIAMAAKRRYKARNRMKLAKYAQSVREVKALGDVTSEQWLNQLDIFDNRCAYCNNKFERLTMDHFRPISKGGTHTINNVVPACQPCNSKKKDSLIFDWLPRFKRDGVI